MLTTLAGVSAFNPDSELIQKKIIENPWSNESNDVFNQILSVEI